MFRSSLGVIIEATFKLRPLPEHEAYVQRTFGEIEEATCYIESLLGGKLSPVIVDLHNLSRANGGRSGSSSGEKDSNRYRVILGLAGAHEDVADELKQVGEFGPLEPADLSYEALFWSSQFSQPVRKRSVLPSRLGDILRDLGDISFVARAGNGIVYCRGGLRPTAADSPHPLFRRIKDAFDPKHIFPDLTE